MGEISVVAVSNTLVVDTHDGAVMKNFKGRSLHSSINSFISSTSKTLPISWGSEKFCSALYKTYDGSRSTWFNLFRIILLFFHLISVFL